MYDANGMLPLCKSKHGRLFIFKKICNYYDSLNCISSKWLDFYVRLKMTRITLLDFLMTIISVSRLVFALLRFVSCNANVLLHP